MSVPSASSKLPDVGTTIFTVMTAMANKYGAHNLAQGFPEFEPDPWLRDRVKYYIDNGYNQYAPMMGIAPIREAIAEKLQDYYNYRVNPLSEVTVTSGATEAIFVAIQSVVKPGDEVIIFDPAYDSYDPAVRLAGGKAVHLPLTEESFAIDWQLLSDSINSRTRLVIINSPHNPTGAILRDGDLERLADLLENTDCLLLSDEVYEHIIFENEAHASVLKNQRLAERSFVVSSFGKTYHMTGWKIGYCVAPAKLST
ncbi:MAG: aminotransferase class I/II-fold pyridoxal phosphate-dependent enzyme, partial [Enterobacterales bacterium]|nr:aminotransferase class I/II-fold pyridoxal phosphate-dependent enzyme [Enterobacterales bacterium]